MEWPNTRAHTYENTYTLKKKICKQKRKKITKRRVGREEGKKRANGGERVGARKEGKRI